MAALCVYSIHSWRKFGLELDAFQEYGIFTQAYGMAVFPLTGNLERFHLYGKNTVVLLGNQMERFYPLVILGNKQRISPRSMVRKCDEANGSVIFRSFR